MRIFSSTEVLLRAQQAESLAASTAILAMLRGDPEERKRAQWAALRAVMSDLSRLVPRTLPSPAVLSGVTLEQLEAALRLMRDGEERSTLAEAFDAFRRAVAQLEVDNALRLE